MFNENLGKVTREPYESQTDDFMEKKIQSSILRQLQQIKPECNMELSDMGNGWLFAEIFKDQCRFDATAREWYIYNNGVWQQDTGDMTTSKYAKKLADNLFIYCTEIIDSKLKEPFIKHCAKLGQLRYRKTMIEDARDHHFFYAEELDKDLFLLNCQNGVLDLKTFEFMEHSPDLFEPFPIIGRGFFKTILYQILCQMKEKRRNQMKYKKCSEVRKLLILKAF